MESTRTQPFGLLVIGSGPAGVHAAISYVESGGPGAVGLVTADHDDPYQRPPLSKAVLAGDQAAEVSPILDDGDSSAWGRIDFRSATRVDSLDTDRRLVLTHDGLDLFYDKLVVATGSEPTPLPSADAEAPVFQLRSLDQARRLVEAVGRARTVVVVGSGFIGCEAAASLAHRGLRTILVTPELAPQSARLGDWVGARIAQWLSEMHVEMRVGVKVDGVDPEGTVTLDDGSRIEADVVLAAVGVSQSRPFLEESGLRIADGRLVVDEELRSSDPHVWAAGDVAQARHPVVGRPLTVEHWGDAISMGRIAGRNAATHRPDGSGQTARWSDPPGFWSEIGEHTLKYSAWGDGFHEVAEVEHGDGSFTVWYADADGELVGVLAHERDEDYERGGELLARRASLDEARGAAAETGSS